MRYQLSEIESLTEPPVIERMHMAMREVGLTMHYRPDLLIRQGDNGHTQFNVALCLRTIWKLSIVCRVGENPTCYMCFAAPPPYTDYIEKCRAIDHWRDGSMFVEDCGIDRTEQDRRYALAVGQHTEDQLMLEHQQFTWIKAGQKEAFGHFSVDKPDPASILDADDDLWHRQWSSDPSFFPDVS